MFVLEYENSFWISWYINSRKIGIDATEDTNVCQNCVQKDSQSNYFFKISKFKPNYIFVYLIRHSFQFNATLALASKFLN